MKKWTSDILTLQKFDMRLRDLEIKYRTIPQEKARMKEELEAASTVTRNAKEQQQKAAKTPLVTFAEEPAMQVLQGRYGPYISFNGKNYPIPRNTDPAMLTIEQAREIIAKKDAKAKK